MNLAELESFLQDLSHYGRQSDLVFDFPYCKLNHEQNANLGRFMKELRLQAGLSLYDAGRMIRRCPGRVRTRELGHTNWDRHYMTLFLRYTAIIKQRNEPHTTEA